MKAFGFFSFGHYSLNPQPTHPHMLSARDMLHQSIELAVEADRLGVNGAYFRVHHFAPQQAAPPCPCFPQSPPALRTLRSAPA